MNRVQRTKITDEDINTHVVVGGELCTYEDCADELPLVGLYWRATTERTPQLLTQIASLGGNTRSDEEYGSDECGDNWWNTVAWEYAREQINFLFAKGGAGYAKYLAAHCSRDLSTLCDFTGLSLEDIEKEHDISLPWPCAPATVPVVDNSNSQ